MHGNNNYAFINGANLHLTYQNLEWKLDYQKLLGYLRNKFNVSVAHYFIGNTQQNADIRQNLESYGYTVKLKTPSPYKTDELDCPYCGKLIMPERIENKADVDSFLTLTAISDLHFYDKAVLISSDGDFDELVKRLMREDKLRMVFAPYRKGCSKLLKKVAVDKIAFIDDFRDDLEKIWESSYRNLDP
jgi:uncharacterized LabA/DUF88 family protein